MKQNRFQPLNTTYQQLGTLLCKTALRIQSTDYTSISEWTSLIQRIHSTRNAFKDYAVKEEAVLFPVLHNYEPALKAVLYDNQYYRMHYLNALCELFTTMANASDKLKSRLFSHKLLYRLDEFVAAATQQLNEQEQMINAVLWKYYSDKELGDMTAALSIKKNHHRFAGQVINHIVHSAVMQPAFKSRRAANTFKQSLSESELAVAI